MLRPIAWFASCLAVVSMFSLADVSAQNESAEAKEDVKEKIVCPISGRSINPKATAEHNDAEVYFCCNNCVKRFNEDSTAYTSKANLQLAATKQAKQKACPISGRDVNKSKTVELKQGEAAVVVAFCCERCQGAAKSAGEEKRLEMLFGKEAFEKGFEVPEDEESDSQS